MWPVSRRFLDTLTHSHRRRVYVDVLVDGQLAVTLDSTLVKDPLTGSLVQSIGGRIQVDKSEVRRSGSINLVDMSGAVAASDVAELFTPTRSEVRAWIGVDYWDAPQTPQVGYVAVGGPAAPPALVNQTTGAAAAATNATVTVSSTAGNCLIAVVTRGTGATGTLSGVIDSAGNTWTKCTDGSVSGSNNTHLEVWKAETAAAVTSVTFQSGTSSVYGWTILEFSNVTAASALDVASPTGSGNAAATTQATPSITTLNANDVLIAAIHYPTNTGTLTTAGWTALTNFDDGVSGSGRAAYQVVSATGSYSASWNLGASVAAGTATVALKGSSTGGFSYSAVVADPVVTEYCPVGTLVVTAVAGAYPAITVSGYDRMWMVGPFVNAYKVPVGTVHSEAIKAILALQMPANRLDVSGIIGTEHTTGLLAYTEQENAQTAVQDIAEATGQVLYCDPLGAFTTRKQSATDDQPVAVYGPGSASIMMRPVPSLDASQSYNAVVFTGETADGTPPVRGYAQDNNPLSITYAPRSGLRPLFASSPLIRTRAQAQLAAQTRLLGILGVPDTTTVPIVPNPAHDSGDVIFLSDPQQGINHNVIIDGFTLGLRASDGEQSLTCRSNVIAL